MTVFELTRLSTRLLIASLATASLVGCRKTPPAPPPPEPPSVSIVTTRAEAIAIVDELPGRVVPFRIAEVRPQVGGIVRRRTFTEGGSVTAGQALYQIDPAPFQADVEGAAATLARSRAALDRARVQADRTQLLSERNAVSQETVDDAIANHALASAEVAQANATLKRSRLNLRYATITAPIDGRIGASRITEGALVSPSDFQPLATIQQIDQVYVDIKEPVGRFEELRSALDRGAIRRDGDAEVAIVSTSGAPYEERGRLLFSDISVDPGTGEVTLRALVPNPNGRLLPGLFVRARISRGIDPQAIAIPQQAVTRDPSGGAQVFVVGRDRKIVVRSIETGRVVDGRYVVTRGLSPGENVVVEGQERLAPGTAVHSVPWEAPRASASR